MRGLRPCEVCLTPIHLQSERGSVAAQDVYQSTGVTVLPTAPCLAGQRHFAHLPRKRTGWYCGNERCHRKTSVVIGVNPIFRDSWSATQQEISRTPFRIHCRENEHSPPYT
jgi:hypothetical protein